jgi:hypothetical protein
VSLRFELGTPEFKAAYGGVGTPGFIPPINALFSLSPVLVVI